MACTLVDVMACVPIEQHAFELGPRDYLNHYFHIMAKLRGGTRYFPLLLSKAHDALPRMTEPSLTQMVPSSLECHFESTSEGSGDESPSLELEHHIPHTPPAYKTEFSNEVGDSGYAESYLLLRESSSPLSIS